MFVFARENLRPYKRIERRFATLFETAYKDFKRFKQYEVSNFSRTTEMCMQLSQDIEVVKHVLETVEAMFGEFEQSSRATNTDLLGRTDELILKSDRYGKLLNRLEKDILKTGEVAEAEECRGNNLA